MGDSSNNNHIQSTFYKVERKGKTYPVLTIIKTKQIFMRRFATDVMSCPVAIARDMELAVYATNIIVIIMIKKAAAVGLKPEQMIQ